MLYETRKVNGLFHSIAGLEFQSVECISTCCYKPLLGSCFELLTLVREGIGERDSN